jgi:hypothetical protein
MVKRRQRRKQKTLLGSATEQRLVKTTTDLEGLAYAVVIRRVHISVKRS